MITILFFMATIIITYAGMWRVFEKAGRPGWAAIIPIYNIYIMAKIGGKPGWWVVLLLIPIVNIIIGIMLYHALAKSFGKGVGYAFGLLFLSFIFFPILGFGDAYYQGEGGMHPEEEGILDSEIV